MTMCLVACVTYAKTEPVAATAWFTDVEVEARVETAKPVPALPEAPGTLGKGVRLTNAVPVENPALAQPLGYIAFWLKPDWNGNDGKTRRLLRIGDPGKNGLLVEKSDLGILRFVMASPKRISAARTDVSDWQAGEWHHVAVYWKSIRGKPVCLTLWIDTWVKDGPVTGDNVFLDPAAMDDARVWIGEMTSEAVMDELIMRNTLKTKISTSNKPNGLILRDYFRTAPYRAIRIDPEPARVPAERRVIAGFKKAFGLEARRGTEWKDVVNTITQYSNWGGFDAKPYITWSTSNEKIATVDKHGLVTGQEVGRCTLTAGFRGMKAAYDLQVIRVEQPDLDLAFVERARRYRSDRVKTNPAPGERVTSIANIYNMGYKSVPAGTGVKFELFPALNRNYRVDLDEEKLAKPETRTIGALAPMEHTTASVSWSWPETPIWVRVTVDPENTVKELCEVNNRKCSLNTARPMRWGYIPDVVKQLHEEKTITVVGSFSAFDWIGAEMWWVETLQREAVYPWTSPDGVQDSVRLDQIAKESDILAGKGQFKDLAPREEMDAAYWDGGWPHGKINDPFVVLAGMVHECGHVMLKLPDLYGYPMAGNRVFLRDENGELYEGGELLPYIHERWLRLPRAPNAGTMNCGVGYASLMSQCHLWLNEESAAKIQHYAGFRGDAFWGSQSRLIPTWQNIALVLDINDRPLPGAAVYVYQVNNPPGMQSAAAKYFYDRVKFMGNTDEDGQFVFPKKTDKDWDDPGTDEGEGSINVWNPFGRVPGSGQAMPDVPNTPTCWGVTGLLLLKIVNGDQTEFHWMDLGQFNVAYVMDPLRGVYTIRTSLRPSKGETPLVRKEVPEAIRKQNLAPVVIVNAEGASLVKKGNNYELTLVCGQEFTLDGSASHDPEGQPMALYEWNIRGRPAPVPRSATGPVYPGKAPRTAGETRMLFFVNDGIRSSKPTWIKIKVVEKEAEETAKQGE